MVWADQTTAGDWSVGFMLEGDPAVGTAVEKGVGGSVICASEQKRLIQQVECKAVAEQQGWLAATLRGKERGDSAAVRAYQDLMQRQAAWEAQQQHKPAKVGGGATATVAAKSYTFSW